MDSTIKFYQECVKNLLCEYESIQDEDSLVELIFDDERMRYMAFWIGWYQYKRIHQCMIHIDIVEDYILIQCNDTEESIVAKLAKKGVSEDRISLGFIHPQHQEYREKEIDIVSVGIG